MMDFDKLPDWVDWLAQDADGTWHPQGVGRGCPRREEAVVVQQLKLQQPRSKAAKAATATLWGYEAEPNQQDRGWYENEVGRILRVGKTAPPEDWQTMLLKRPR